MDRTIKPIETVYNGFRFRSRLEARWAVFFDAIGLKYEYEIEGYATNSICYLPDFYIPSLNRWFEIKGKPLTNEEMKADIDIESFFEKKELTEKELALHSQKEQYEKTFIGRSSVHFHGA